MLLHRIEETLMLYYRQFGFDKGKSTVDVALLVVDTIDENNQDVKFAFIVFSPTLWNIFNDPV